VIEKIQIIFYAVISEKRDFFWTRGFRFRLLY